MSAAPPVAPLGVARLVVVTNVTHYRHEGRVYAYGPYAREIGVWATLFPSMEIAAPERTGPPPGDALPIDGDVRVLPQAEVGGTTWASKLRLVATLPRMTWSLARALRGAEAIHVRCPGNLGLLGALLAPLFARRRVAKYAGQWSGYPGEAWTVRLQRAILRSRWWGAPVLAYTASTDEPPHVVPFFSTALSAAQIAAPAAAAPREGSLRLLFVGRLSRNKNVDVLLDAVAALVADGMAMRCTIVGHGEERTALERRTSALGLGGVVEYTGAVGVDDVLGHYRRSDVLILPSTTEGWPKVLVEAMAFGLDCIGPDCGVVPTILGDGRGIVVHAGDVAELVHAIRRIAARRADDAAGRREAVAWASRYTLEGFGASLRDVLHAHWPRRLPPGIAMGREAHGV